MNDIEARYAEHRPPEPSGDIGYICYVCGELANPDTGSCRDCGATWITDEMRRVGRLVHDMYQLDGMGVGGPLHIVTDDLNVEDRNLQFCEVEFDGWFDKWYEGDERAEAERLAREVLAGLRPMTEWHRTATILLADTPEDRVGRVADDYSGPDVDLFGGGGPPERVEAPFQHTGLVGRYPAGTDPRRAVREMMTEFMTRTDGTNALPWWLRSDDTWWHGSGDGIRVGDELMPPSITGIVPHLPGTDTTSVYVTRRREDAVMYSCWHRRPMLYEVSFPDEPQPDDVVDDPNSFRVPKATVRRVHGLTRPEVEAALRRVLDLPER